MAESVPVSLLEIVIVIGWWQLAAVGGLIGKSIFKGKEQRRAGNVYLLLYGRLPGQTP